MSATKPKSNENPLPGETFRQWFERQSFKYFTAREFENYFKRSRNGVSNSEPPRALWKNILPALRMAEKAREFFKCSCTINSSYRSPEYNRAINGAKLSQHIKFKALDLSFGNATPQEAFEFFKDRRAKGDFKGGLGLYKTFVHIDDRGENTTW